MKKKFAFVMVLIFVLLLVFITVINKGYDTNQPGKKPETVSTQEVDSQIKEINWELGKAFPEIDFDKMSYLNILLELEPKGYLLGTVSFVDIGKDRFYSFKKQWLELPILKIDFIYPGLKTGWMVYSTTNQRYGKNSGGGIDIRKTFVVPMVDSQLIQEHGMQGLAANFKAGDMLRFCSFKITTDQGEYGFSFSKKNPFATVKIPETIEREKTYQIKVDILKAAEFEKKISREKKDIEAQKFLAVELSGEHASNIPQNHSRFKEKEIWYWTNGVCNVKKVKGNKIFLPREASGSPVSLLQKQDKNTEERTPMALIKKLPNRNISIDQCADWIRKGGNLFQTKIEIFPKFLAMNNLLTVCISATKPRANGELAPVYINVLTPSEKGEKISLSAPLFEGNFWFIIKPTEGPLRNYWIAPLKISKNSRKIVLTQMKRVEK